MLVFYTLSYHTRGHTKKSEIVQLLASYTIVFFTVCLHLKHTNFDKLKMMLMCDVIVYLTIYLQLAWILNALQDKHRTSVHYTIYSYTKHHLYFTTHPYKLFIKPHSTVYIKITRQRGHCTQTIRVYFVYIILRI